ncbi:MAG: hypothetical protein WBD02_02645 [Acidimicrobiia bacterium]
MPSAFLSETWIIDAQTALHTHSSELPTDVNMIANVIVASPPDHVHDADIELHLGSADTKAIFQRGLHETANVTLRTDYATAHSIFLSGDPQAGLQALMAGKVKISGDLAALMAAASSGVGPGNPALASALREITAE